MAKTEFEAGDIVQIKSGGPDMTVEGGSNLEPGNLSCVWFAGDEIRRANFRPECLETAGNE